VRFPRLHWRKLPDPRIEVDDTALAAARRERELSERRLSDALPLRTVITQMHRVNHVGGYLDEVVKRRIDKEEGTS
jgi:Arc/MetJ family transcription regulator